MKNNFKNIENSIYVKITLFDKNGHGDKVVYYRNKITVAMSIKWKWYFEYLAALIKINNPRLKVELTICTQNLLQGNEYVVKKTKDLLSHKRGQLNKLMTANCHNDIFGFTQKETENKIERIRQEIATLERGKFNYYVPNEYINNVKMYGKIYNGKHKEKPQASTQTPILKRIMSEAPQKNTQTVSIKINKY